VLSLGSVRVTPFRNQGFLEKGPSTMKPDQQKPSTPDRHTDDFQRQAEQKQPSIVAEFIDFLLHNKKWWLIPIIVVFLVFGLIVFLSGTGVAPFIYTLF
jgi:hypothetical protein